MCWWDVKPYSINQQSSMTSSWFQKCCVPCSVFLSVQIHSCFLFRNCVFCYDSVFFCIFTSLFSDSVVTFNLRDLCAYFLCCQCCNSISSCFVHKIVLRSLLDVIFSASFMTLLRCRHEEQSAYKNSCISNTKYFRGSLLESQPNLWSKHHNSSCTVVTAT